MEKVHISQFYACSQVDLACELYYICELGKYLSFNYDKCLSVDGVILHNVLLKSPLWDAFRIAVMNGWVVDANVAQDDIDITIQSPLKADTDTLANILFTFEEVPFDRNDFDKRQSDFMYNMVTPKLTQISMVKKDSDEWIWGIYGENRKYFNINNKAMNFKLSHQAWLSMVAMVAVHRLMEKEPMSFSIQLDRQVLLNVLSSAYLIMLDYKTNCLKGWCTYDIDSKIPIRDQNQLGYSAWYIEGKDRGMLNRWYSGVEKIEYMKQLGIQAGDIVMVYRRDKTQKLNYIKSIHSCRLAHISYITDNAIGFEFINTTKTKFHGKKDFYNKSTAIRAQYYEEPYKKLNTSAKKLDIMDVGIEYMLYTEEYFILPLDKCDDIKELWVTDGVREDHLVLQQNDAVYWILKDYDFFFNEERFLKKYFPDQEPAYTRYMRGECLEDSLYYDNIINAM